MRYILALDAGTTSVRALVFDHDGMGEAMKGLFDEYWGRGKQL